MNHLLRAALLMAATTGTARASTPSNPPQLVGPDLVLAAGQAGANFGTAVTTAGDVNRDGYSDLLVGAPSFDNGQNNEGSVFLYFGGSAGLTSTPAWVAEGDAAGLSLGNRVDTAGDVNGDGYDDVILGGFGMAMAFYGGPGGLGANGNPANADWTVTGTGQLGAAVAYAGDMNRDGYADVLVGAPTFTNGQSNEGRASLYLGGPAGLASTPAWSFESDAAGSDFARSLAAGDLNGDGYPEVIVGAKQFSNGQSSEGCAFVFNGGPAGPATTPSWVQEGEAPGIFFGTRVSGQGDINADGYCDLVVTAPIYSGAVSAEGAAMVYYGSPSGPSHTPDIILTGGSTSDTFGIGESTAGDVNGDGYADITIGADTYTGTLHFEGRIDIYLGGAAGLSPAPITTCLGGSANGLFGVSSSGIGDVNGDGLADVAGGAIHGGADGGGQVLVLYGRGTLPDPLPTATTTGFSDESLYGEAVAVNGDVNGDGYSDLLVGAPATPHGSFQEGAAALYLGGSSGLNTQPSWVAYGTFARAYFGHNLAYAGDVNADGYDDALVGSPSQLPGSQINPIGASLYLGSASGLSPTPAWTAGGFQARTQFGYAVARAGDLNQDGFADIAVGAPDYGNGQLGEGAVYIYLGAATGVSATPAWILEQNETGAALGRSIRFAGDIDGDGLPEFAVGAPNFDDGGVRPGAVFIYEATTNGPPEMVQQVTGLDNASLFGTALVAGVDWNGDGYSDLFVGAPAGQGELGAVYLFPGGPAGLAADALILVGDAPVGSFGASVAFAGDVDGNGYGDLLVGDPFDNGGINQGRAVLYSGGPILGAVMAEYRSPVEGSFGSVGYAVAANGDVNGDGAVDIVAGAPYEDVEDPHVGAVYLFAGKGGFGPVRLSRQQQPGLLASNAPLAWLGRSHATDSVQLFSRERSAAGRANVRAAVEIKAQGGHFTGSELTRSPLHDSGTVGALGSFADETLAVTSLNSDTFYHWRLRTETDNPYFPHGPWTGLPQNGFEEADFRTAKIAAGVDEVPALASGLRVGPNPFARDTALSFALTRRGEVRIDLVDAAGRRVRRLLDQVMESGEHLLSWDGRDALGRDVPDGVYFAHLASNAGTRVTKLVRER